MTTGTLYTLGYAEPNVTERLEALMAQPRTALVDIRYAPYSRWAASWCNNQYPVPPVLASCQAKDMHGEKAPTCPPETPCRGLERARHVVLTHDWFANFRTREPRLYRAPCYQESWLEVAS